jgi:porin
MCTRVAIRAGVVFSILAGLSAGAASAQAADQDWAAPVSESLESLAERGVSISPKVTQFVDGLVFGDGDYGPETGGKLDFKLGLASGPLGLWEGAFLNLHFEQVWGEDVNQQGDGSIIPINTALAFPRLGGSDTNLSVTLTQVFDGWSVTLGKFNMLDAAAATPLIGGGGTDTFQNLGLAAPVSGVTPPYLLGGLLSVSTAPAEISLLVYDPRNAQNDNVLEAPFEDGVTFSLSATHETTIAGKPGYYGVRGVYSTLEGVDLKDIPQLILPPGFAAPVSNKKGYLFGSVSFQQFLSLHPDDPTKGWGVFGQGAISDGNPNPIRGSLLFGVGGAAPFSGRSNDRWGIAGFRYFFSDVLKDSADAVAGAVSAAESFGIRDEWGFEAYYDLEIVRHVRVGADAQFVRPGTPDRDTAFFLGVRGQVVF